MARIEDDADEKPLDPAVERVRRKLVRFVAINLGLLLAALMAVLAALVYKTSFSGGEAGGGASVVPAPADAGLIEGTIPLPPGARLLGQSLSGNRIALDVELEGGQRSILVYDIGERRIVGSFAVQPQ